MSLTSELKNQQSRISLLLRTRFPNTRKVVASSNKVMANVVTHRPAEQVPWSLIGQAIDYRLRFYFPDNSIEHLVAYQGAQVACGINAADFEQYFAFSLRSQGMDDQDIGSIQTPPDHLDWRLAGDFFADLNRFIHQVQPAMRRLKQTDEDTLLKYCVVLAAFETFYRQGFDTRSILLTPQPKTSINDLLAVAKSSWLDDLRVLSWGFYDVFHPLMDQEAILNPTFDGSNSVGGADADLIIGNCLVDIKTTINPRLEPVWLYQLLGYVILDWEDKYNIQEVAIYFPRQQFLLMFLRSLNMGVPMLDGVTPEHDGTA